MTDDDSRLPVEPIVYAATVTVLGLSQLGVMVVAHRGAGRS